MAIYVIRAEPFVCPALTISNSVPKYPPLKNTPTFQAKLVQVPKQTKTHPTNDLQGEK